MDWAKEIVSKKVFENNIVNTESNNKYVAQNCSLNYEVKTIKGTEHVEVTFGFMEGIPIAKCTVNPDTDTYPRLEMVIPQGVLLRMIESGFEKVERGEND
tara:strand:+ start:659 stop:958 length:300 start_codon:yes stop_codon:yes gene_type:complete